ncbi:MULTISPECIES: hypothetical protein [Xanthomonas translucens group]|uniref:hypothetical protein n=1 Tax=Xanthomonas translucens group TaxID=3390202 RepID=UPI001112E0E9|nr:hypothetical protein [Xanthomonas translucens]UKE46242.1 hypothetical protein KHA79_14060 [Xanthomonas translucens pv. cerealis]
MRKSYAIAPKQPAPRRLPTVRIAAEKAAAFRALARQQGLTPTAALAALVNAHAEIREPFSSRVRAKAGQGPRYTDLLPDPKVPKEQAELLAGDAKAARITLGEAMRQLVERCLKEGG